MCEFFFSMGESYIQLSNILEEPPKTSQIVQKLEFFLKAFAPGERAFAGTRVAFAHSKAFQIFLIN